MAKVNQIFKRIEEILKVEYESGKILCILKDNDKDCCENKFNVLKGFLQSIFEAIDSLSKEIINDETLLVSVKDQKLLQTCFQLIVSLGISRCLIDGLGISLSKRYILIQTLEHIAMNDDQKYEIIVACTDFFTRCYNVPIIKNIIVTFHLSDYLASLLQLSFAPLKTPGIYANFTMTEEMYKNLNIDKRKYMQVYENLVNNCFQPILMKELLVLQNVTNKKTPTFLKKVIAKEMSNRLIAPGGLLSLIRCFLESYNEDTGHDWIKINMICKIVATKHANMHEDDYLSNMTLQLSQILTLHNMQYLVTAITCILNLYDKYPRSLCVKDLKILITQCFDIDLLLSKSNSPSTLVATPLEVEHNISILYCTFCVVKYEWDEKIASNLYVLFLLGIACTKTEIKLKLKDIILKCIEYLDQTHIHETVERFLYGRTASSLHVSVEVYEAGLGIKCTSDSHHPKQEALLYFIELFYSVSNNNVVQKLIKSCLNMFMELNENTINHRNNNLLNADDSVALLNECEEDQANILQLLTEISSSPKTITTLKSNPFIVIDFVEKLLLKSVIDTNEEYVTIALVLLNTVLSNMNSSKEVQQKLFILVPVLKKIAEKEYNYNAILCKEILSHISSEYTKQVNSAYERVMVDIFDNLIPVRAHGIIELTKLVESNDPETISKRHFIFCLLQEQLKDSDSYIYLSVINAIGSLATHCTEDVLSVLCKEFLQISRTHDSIQTSESENSITELRVKVGDIVVKVTRRLGEMAAMYKATLLNTMLCACRDADPLIRTSALSNLAEIAMVLNHKLGTIIYEVLLCIWGTIESDVAIDCRRAAVMVISSLLKGLDKATLLELKENLLPMYRSLIRIYKDDNEDSVVRLHAQIALEELNSIVNQFFISDVSMERKFVLSQSKDIVFK